MANAQETADEGDLAHDLAHDMGKAAGEHLRLCVATRAERPPAELIRFVAGPDNTLVPDLARRLPGRGVWVSADAASLEKAIKVRAFSRALKREVRVPPDLAANVVNLLARRATDALALANKAGLVTAGFAQVEPFLESGKALALLHGSDAAAGGRDKLDRKWKAISAARGRDAAVVDWLTIDEISLAMGRPNVVHAGLTDGGASRRFLEEARRLRGFRSGREQTTTD